MTEYIEPLENLIEQFQKLAGVGRKTAVRLAFSLIDGPEEQAQAFSDAILHARRDISTCPVCQNLSAGGLCPICANPARDRKTICVVQDAKAVISIERVKEYHGLYHVLHGALSPMNGVTPDSLRINELMERLKDGETEEIILATNPTIEGETTALYLARLLKDTGIRVTRLAYGVPVGGDLEYADEVTLFRALEGRKDL